jgi:hypothetical protein
MIDNPSIGSHEDRKEVSVLLHLSRLLIHTTLCWVLTYACKDLHPGSTKVTTRQKKKNLPVSGRHQELSPMRGSNPQP